MAYLEDSGEYLHDGLFITPDDYKVVIGDTALKVISQVSEEVRINAQAEAEEEIASYLRPTYDTAAIFSAQDEKRNRHLVMITVDIALYHMAAAMPQRMGIEVRKERYERAIKWLEGVQAGKIIPNLPRPAAEDDNDNDGNASAIIYHSQPKLRHNW